MSAPRTTQTPPAQKVPESEKITINLGFVDLGQIELLVREGFYSNRSDFIRTAIRNQIERHADTVRQIVVRRSVDLGLRHITHDELVAARAQGVMLDIRVLGLAVIAPDVTPDLARATLSALTVLGTLHADDAVRAAIADRIT
ncbi:MAG: CopG family transcriptional regulator [Rhodobacteraceae bacterium]|jgi:Arc/MetJ-type ribon-helix-helix transcriptional regulator|nr:CopG family transcriptional regulator [Paracoccaceae bacterium]